MLLAGGKAVFRRRRKLPGKKQGERNSEREGREREKERVG